MSTTDTRAAFEAWWESEPDEDKFTFDELALMRRAWNAAIETTKATGTAGELPPLPEMESIADMPRAQKVPPDWDSDYTSIWQRWQVAERNKMQWRTYALSLHAILCGVNAVPVAEAARQPAPALPVSELAKKLNALDMAIAHSTNLTPHSKPRRLLAAIIHEVCSDAALAATAAPVLSDEQIADIAFDTMATVNMDANPELLKFARAIIAATTTYRR